LIQIAEFNVVRSLFPAEWAAVVAVDNNRYPIWWRQVHGSALNS